MNNVKINAKYLLKLDRATTNPGNRLLRRDGETVQILRKVGGGLAGYIATVDGETGSENEIWVFGDELKELK